MKPDLYKSLPALLLSIFFLASLTIAKAQCSISDKPTFGFNFNGINVFNINNGVADASESVSVSVCNGSQYFTSGHFYSSPSNMYNLSLVFTGGVVYVDGGPPTNAVITAGQLSASAGTHTLSLADPNVGGAFVQTITPFADLNDDGILDAGDCAGDPIVFTHICTPQPTWYLDADGDHHASKTIRSCGSPGAGWTLTPLAVDDCNDNDPTPCPNTPPRISLTSPFKPTNYVTPGPIRLSADASDSGGTIQSVSFFNGSTLIFTDTTAPYTGLWQSVPTGKFTITAVATDNTGLKTTSSPVRITVLHNIPPYVEITSPADGTTYYTAPATIVLSAAAEAHGGKIKTVKFYHGTTLLHTEENTPYVWTWHNVAAGSYILKARTIDTYGRTSSSSPVHIIVTGKSCDSATRPTFSYNLNGIKLGNINNGLPDPCESGHLTLCNGGKYTESGFITSDTANLYQIVYGEGSGNSILFNGSKRTSRVITAARFMSMDRVWTVTSTDPNQIAEAVQTITPFRDLNNNKVLDAGDCAGDPIIEDYVLGTCTTTCSSATRPTFGFNFNGKSVADINNGLPDSSESAGLIVCDGTQYTTSSHFSSSFSNLYNITYTASGGTLLFNGFQVYPSVLTAVELAGTAGTYTISLADGNTGGTLTQTITPFADFNNDRILDAGDCTGDPIVFTYAVSPCNSVNYSAISLAPVNAKIDINRTLSMKLLPNPAQNILNINTTGLQPDKRSFISVISSAGVTIKTVESNSSAQIVQLNVSSLASGIYIIKVSSGDKIMYRQFVKM